MNKAPPTPEATGENTLQPQDVTPASSMQAESKMHFCAETKYKAG